MSATRSNNVSSRTSATQVGFFRLESACSVVEYRKQSIIQNERCKKANHYEPAMYELLKVLRQVHDRMYGNLRKQSRSGSRGTIFKHRDVACHCDGGNHGKNTTVKQAVYLAIRLSPGTIEKIGEIAKMSFAEIILNFSELNSRKLKSTEAVLSAYDCRL